MLLKKRSQYRRAAEPAATFSCPATANSPLITAPPSPSPRSLKQSWRQPLKQKSAPCSSTPGQPSQREKHWRKWDIRNRARPCKQITPPPTWSSRTTCSPNERSPWICASIGCAIARPNNNFGTIGGQGQQIWVIITPNIIQARIIRMSDQNLLHRAEF